MCSPDVLLGIFALIIPPLPVWVKRGVCSADSLINICLCMLGFLPGLFHAWYIIAKYPDPYYYDYEALPDDQESGRRHYIYVVQDPPQRPNGASYGTRDAPATSASPAPPAPEHQAQQQGYTDAGASGSTQAQGVPPTYAQAVAGDNKIQSHE